MCNRGDDMSVFVCFGRGSLKQTKCKPRFSFSFRLSSERQDRARNNVRAHTKNTRNFYKHSRRLSERTLAET